MGLVPEVKPKIGFVHYWKRANIRRVSKIIALNPIPRYLIEYTRVYGRWGAAIEYLFV
jgi:hypothetical protein